MANFFRAPAVVTFGRSADGKSNKRGIVGSVTLNAQVPSSAIVNVAGFNTPADVAVIDVSSLRTPSTFQIRSCLITAAYEQDPNTAGDMLSTPVIVYNPSTGEAVFIPFQNYAAQDQAGNNASPMVTACFPFYCDNNSSLQIIEPVETGNSVVAVQVSFMFFEEERAPFTISGMSTFPFGVLV